MKSFRLGIVLLVAVLATSSAFAQTRGRGRMSGKVVDEQDKPIADVQISGLKAGDSAPVVAKTNEKGEWLLQNLSGGEWKLQFTKAGLAPIEEVVVLKDGERLENLVAKMGADPNAAINAELQKAVEFVKAGQVAEARKVYEDLLAKHPSVYQFHNFIARAYAGENNLPKAIEHTKLALEKEPANVEYQLLHAELLLMSGSKEEARKVLDVIDMTQVKDPFPFVNSAIYLINEGKGDEAVAAIDKLIKQFPNDISLYYYRGRAYVAAKKFDEAKADFEKFVAAAPTDSKEVADAKKLLEQLVKK